jgi:hypothetical protein
MASVAKWLRQWFVVPPFVGSIPIVRPEKYASLSGGIMFEHYHVFPLMAIFLTFLLGQLGKLLRVPLLPTSKVLLIFYSVGS